MIFFITFLRALAACLITNSHYTGVYPADIIANGGLIGDILFFAVSGYCLCNVKLSFPRWYGKRLWRVYLPVWIATGIYLLVGGYTFASLVGWQGMGLPQALTQALTWFLYPTYYHFIASIILLYIPFYAVMKLKPLRNHIPLVMLALLGVMLAVYLFFYDKSYYHIDTVREPFIRFLFMESMLLGAHFKLKDGTYRNRFSWGWVALLAVSFVAYFASKLLFSRLSFLSPLQMVNQALIFLLLYATLRVCAGLDAKLERMPKFLRVAVTFLADRTLEIYVVQYVLIEVLRPFFGFPLNWLVLTASILAAASILHILCKGIYGGVDLLIAKCRRKEKA